MTPNTLKSVVHSEIRQSLGYISSKLNEDRIKALNYYLQRPFGNEQEGRSSVVTSDVADTVDWILPSLLRIFTAGPEVVKFEPVGPEDEEAAAQQTEYVNHVFNVDNSGFLILHTMFKDALLQKNGIAKTWWEEKKTPITRTYRGTTEDEAAKLIGDDDEVTEKSAPVDGKLDFTKRKVKKTKRCRVANVPPENFLISKDAKTIEEARLVGEVIRKTASDLIAEGFSKTRVDRIPTGDDWLARTDEEEARSMYDDRPRMDEGDSADKSTRLITEVECYVKLDWDDDGIAELRYIRIAGEEILANEPVDDNPYADITPIPMPHRWAGRSVAELVFDLQLIKSTITRQMLDSMYLGLSPRTEVVDGQVNFDDAMTVRPGSLIRVKAPGMMREIVSAPVFQHALPLIEYWDSVKEKRTGVTSYNQGTDVNTLNKTAHGISAILSQAQQKIELIARIFAETGVRTLFKKIYGVISRNQDEQRVIRMRNKWVPIDPTDWSEEMDCTVTVGLGTGSQDAQVQRIMLIMDVQKQAIALQGGWNGPLVDLKGVHAACKALVEAQGLKSVDRYFMDPTSPEGQQLAQQPQPNPQAMAEQMKMQIESEKVQISKAQAQGEYISAERKDQLKAKELELQHFREMAKIQLEGAALQQQGQIEGAKIQQADQHKVVDLKEARQARTEDRTAAVQDRMVDRQASMQDAQAGQQHERAMKNADRTAEGMPTIDYEAEMKQLADAIIASGQATQQAISQIMQQQAQATAALVAAVTAPKRLVRDSAGKPVGVETVGAA